MSMRICRDGGGAGGGGGGSEGERFCQHWCQVSHGGENNPSANKRKSSTGGSVSGYNPPSKHHVQRCRPSKQRVGIDSIRGGGWSAPFTLTSAATLREHKSITDHTLAASQALDDALQSTLPW